MVTGETAVFIMPAPASGSSGPVASWITAAQWAKAARRVYGEARLITPEGLLSPEEALAKASDSSLKPKSQGRARKLVPAVVQTATKDALRLVRARRLRRSSFNGAWQSGSVSLIWQYHYLFENLGSRMSQALGVPLVQRVNAPQVWEAKKWGVSRPVWGGVLERVAERPQLRAADVVACVSAEVADVVQSKFGVERVVVAPNGVDTDRFSPFVSGDAIRERFGLDGKFVVGWSGSFRPFHGVEIALRAAAKLRMSVPDLALLLVGDGQTRRKMQELARRFDLENVVFTGTVEFEEMPSYVAAMDVAVLPDAGHSGFHYSPVKLLEYMATGKPIVAATVGQVAEILEDGRSGYLVAPADVTELARKIEWIHEDPAASREVGMEARRAVLEAWTWDRQFEKVVEAL